MSDMITGLGGAFVYSERPEELARWYGDRFGLRFEGGADFGAWYQVFWALDPENTDRRLDTTFSIMKAKTRLPRAAANSNPKDMYGDQHFMVNLRVSDLDGLIQRLEKEGEQILARQDEDYGLFAWVRDPDGNRVELYQPLCVT